MDIDLIKQEYSKMNKSQQEAVFCTEGPLLILAGAGSGKTTVLVNRISYILKLKLCMPWQILAITFTNKAAAELKNRICESVGEGSENVWAATFHSTCAKILRQYGDRIGFSNHFTVYDTQDSRKLMKDILKNLNIDEKFLPHRSVLSEISKAKDTMTSPDRYLADAGYDNRKISIAKAYKQYQDRLQNSDAMDFDDMLCNTVKLFETAPDVLEYYQNKFRYIMVDEYQDTNNIQYKFVSMLAKKHNNICVVGDDDQSIYKFRGATIENILNFEKTFKGAKVIKLEQNYRSTQNILNAANGVIANNITRKGKTLWTENDTGDKITFHTAYDERDEAKYIADTILKGVANGRKFSDYAVLYRINAQSNAIEYAFSRSGIPHRIIGGHRFYDYEEIKDMTAYLQIINNPHDNVRLTRIINKPKRAIGETTVNKATEIAQGIGESIYTVISHAEDYPELSRAAAKLKDFVKLINDLILANESGDYSLIEIYRMLLESTNYKSMLRSEKDNADTKIENIEELASNIIKFEEDYGDEAELANFLEDISLQTDLDNYDTESDSTVLMTLHSSKGLEFPVVFIAGMEEGIFPSLNSSLYPEEINEERRLAYVGITRAKSKLYITKARMRMFQGSTTFNKPSRFALEIPKSLLEFTGAENKAVEVSDLYQNSTNAGTGNFSKQTSVFIGNKGLRQSSLNQQKQTINYSVGDIVKHNIFGNGMIISCERMGNDIMLEIAFDKVGTKVLMANYAKLTKI